ncbi:MAG: FHA domain-containing protein [Bdellovibrionales bacterium]|nr:FHA domain-containing protein [Bdellovibrionales bacterium]
MASDIIASVTITTADGKEERYQLRDQQDLRIGREESNSIMINEAGVSRFHASLSGSESGVVLVDLASLNGTYVNGERLSGLRDISSQDLIQIGSAKIRVTLAADDVSSVGAGVRARAMTAQMKPVAVSALVLRLNSDGDISVGSYALNTWIDSVSDVVREFDGKIDKKIENVIVALWVGDDAKNQALRAIRTFQKISQSTPDLGQNSSVFGAIASGLGLKGALGASSSGRDFNIVGDPVNAAFALMSNYGAGASGVVFDKATSDHVSTTITTISLDGGGKESSESLYTLSRELLS